MNSITIPAGLKGAFIGTEQMRVCDESGKILGYFTPFGEGTDEDYEWAMRQVKPELIEASQRSGIGRPLADSLAELRRKYCP
jgi:hypothetical protein